jgi:SnoaL-like domain
VKPRIEISSQFLARPLSRSGEADILSPQDRFDMVDLLNTVAWCIDAGDFGVLATIITEDFIYDHPSGSTNGRERFIDFLKSNPMREA